MKVISSYSFLDYHNLFTCIGHLFCRMLISSNVFDIFFRFESGCVYLAGISRQLCWVLNRMPTDGEQFQFVPVLMKFPLITSLRWRLTSFFIMKLFLFPFCNQLFCVKTPCNCIIFCPLLNLNLLLII